MSVMIKKSILIISDNKFILNFFIKALEDIPALREDRIYNFACAPWDKQLVGKKFGDYKIMPIDIKKMYQDVINKYDLVISAHCKQIFPEPLISSIKCINIHPGLNPNNRGWYPQVFSIINGLPLGATIHEIDGDIDHGAIIDQIEVEVESWDTSLDAYNKVLNAEEVILRRSLQGILEDTYSKRAPSNEGNLNLKKDFEALCKIDVDDSTTYGEAIDRLRALTHGTYKNAYYYDKKTQKKVYISVQLEPEA